MELLAPAGSSEALHAAVENGADAVYLGGKLFNARRLADNFEGAELENALRYAHVRGVKIYLTMNTLVSDAEMKEALEFAADAWLSGVDAVIVQDMGFAAALRRAVPDIRLHASTQMTIYNAEGVRMLKDRGFERVVLARELSLDEIKRINEASAAETEVFVHGALCVSYSGQCLMSSVIGGRSGNRGKCAQPCRLPYSLVRQNGRAIPSSYLLSPKDLCLVSGLGKLAEAGVSSLKIEGRMKSPEYVATVVRIYRKYLDILNEKMKKGTDTAVNVEDKDMHDLLQIFNRGGFTKGYSEGKSGRDMMCFEKPKNWGIYLGRVLAADRGRASVKLRLEDGLSIGDGIEAWTGEEKSPGTIVTSILRKGANVKSAAKGEVVTVGSIKGLIPPGCDIYKTSSKGLNKAAEESYTGKPLRRVPLKGRAVLKAGGPFTLIVRDNDGNEAAAAGNMLPEPASVRPVTAERLGEQLGKTGSTPFELHELEMELEEGLSLPVSEINEVRRTALETLENIRGKAPARSAGKNVIEAALRNELGRVTLSHQDVKAEPGISVYFCKLPEDMDLTGAKGGHIPGRPLSELFPQIGADRLYLPFETCLKPGFGEVSEACRKAGSELFLWLPPVTRGNYDRLIKTHLIERGFSGIDGVLAGNPGTVEMLKGVDGLRLAGDLSLNIFNRLSLEEAAGTGLESVMLSAELTLGQTAEIAEGSSVAVEAAAYGRLPLMTSEYCPVGCAEGGFGYGKKCGGSCKTGEFRLKDRLGMEFPVLCDRIDCRSTILNSNALFIPDGLKTLRDSGVRFFRLYISDEPPDTVSKLAELHRKALAGEDISGFKGFVEEIKAGGFTKGHYYRGV